MMNRSTFRKIFKKTFRKLTSWAATAGIVLLPELGPPLRAQDSATTIAVDVKEVTMPVTVRDKHGKIVSDLKKDEFTLQEDGRPQTIKYFTQDANQPLTLGLLVDTSRSQTNVLDAERNASRSFLDQVMVKEKDKAFLIHFDREVELLQDLTSSREKLQHALNEMDAPQFAQPNQQPNQYPQQYPQGGGGRGRGGFAGAGTTLYDAVYLASQDVIQKLQGRK